MIWRPVNGYLGLYEVSDAGIVRSLPRTTPAGKRPGRILKQRIPKRGGYPQVHLSKDGSVVTKRVHVLVLEAFCGPRPDGTVACHGNGNRVDCSINNLRWDTREANESDKRIHGTALVQRGAQNHASKLTEAQARSAIERRRGGATLSSIAAEFGISIGHASELVRGKTWSHLWSN